MVFRPRNYADFDEVAVQRLMSGEELQSHHRSPIRAVDVAEAVRRLAGDGYSDGQIAYLIGYTRRSIIRIRQRRGVRPALTPMQNRYDRIHDTPNRPRLKG